MSKIFQIPLPLKGQPPLAFPERCICCGGPRQAESTLSVKQLTRSGKKQIQISAKYQVPHCERCARSTRAVFLAGLIPFGLGFLMVGGLIFAGVVLNALKWGLDDYGQPNNANSLVLGAAAGLFAGLVGGFLFEVLARAALLPIFGQALFRAPLLSVQLLSDADYVAGLSGKPDAQTRQLILTFFNDEIAREFERLNAGRIGKTEG
jgi:hypothetical protein